MPPNQPGSAAIAQPQFIHVGRADVFVGVALPAFPPVALIQGVPQTGRYIGSTLEPSNALYTPTVFAIETQQSTTEVGHVITKEEMRCEFTAGDFIYENLRDLVIGARDAGAGITLGGNIFPPTNSVLFVAPRRAGGFIQVMIYQAVFSEARTFQFARAADMRPRVIARAEGVLTRQQGDQLGFIWPVVFNNAGT